MKEGIVKHYNAAKGYGFIAVEGLQEDVFFHIKTWTLPTPPSMGQKVHVVIEINSKGKLRASKIYASPLNLEQADHRDKFVKYPIKNQQHPKKSGLLSTVFSLIIVAIVSYFGYVEYLQTPNGNVDNHVTASIAVAQTGVQTTESQTPLPYNRITGDAQIDNTIYLIQQGGPFPYPNKDGTVFSNFEGHLPQQSHGFYHEYTVPTPGISHRGARRIVTGGNPPSVYYLTLDHYDSFSKLQVQ